MNLRSLVTVVACLFFPLLCQAQLNTTRIMEIGRNALYFEDYVLSIRYFNQVIDSKPFLHEPYFYRGLAKFYLEDYNGAEDDFTIAIEKNPYVARNYQLRGLCRANLDSFATAEEDIRMAIKYDPQNVNLWQNLGAVAIETEEWEKAAQVVDSLLLFAPRNSDACRMRSSIAINSGDTLLALEMATRAVEYDKYLAPVYQARAMVYYETGDYEKAEADLDRAIDLMPTRGDFYINRAIIRYNRENLRGAMDDYDMAIYVEPASFAAHYNRGLLRMHLGDDNRAIEDFDWVLGIDPDNTSARFNRGILRENTGNYRGAADDYTIVIENYPHFEYAYERRAVALRKYGDVRGAEADELWLLRRRYSEYNNVSQNDVAEYSAEDDETLRRSEENIRNYNKMVFVDEDDKQYTTEYRGKIQNRSVVVELEPIFVLTYYTAASELGTLTNYSKPVEDLNLALDIPRPLLLVNNERALSSNEVSFHFEHINEISAGVSADTASVHALMLRAIDFCLLQDMESAMADINLAISIDSLSWELYFVRSFVLFKQLETERMNSTGDMLPVSATVNASLPDINYRLVKEDLDKVVEMLPEFAYAYMNRGNVSAKLSDFKSAIIDYTKAIELDDRLAAAYFNRGLAKIYTGNTEGGIEDLSRAGELGLFQAYNVMKRFQYTTLR